MKKMKKVSAQSFEGDSGWHLRDAYAEATRDIARSFTLYLLDVLPSTLLALPYTLFPQV